MPRLAGYALVALALGDAVAPVSLRGGGLQLHAGAGRRHLGGHLGGWIRRSSRAAASSAAAAAGTPPERVREPIAVEYARSFFPVIVLVLVIRSFLFEPFRIPSDSMMPTLVRRRLHLRQQVLLWPAPAGHQHLADSPRAPRSGAMSSCSACRRIPRSTTSSVWSDCRETASGSMRTISSTSTASPCRRPRGRPTPVPNRTCGIMRACRPLSKQLGSQAPSIMFANGSVKRGVGGARRALFLHGRQPQQQQGQPLAGRYRRRRASFRSRIWSVRRCEFGLILILVTDLSGERIGNAIQ